MTAFERAKRALEARGSKMRTDGPGLRTQCPAHDGQDLNLTVRPGREAVLFTCHSHGCAAVDVARALNMSVNDMFDNRKNSRFTFPDGRTEVRSFLPDGKKKITQVNTPKGAQIIPFGVHGSPIAGAPIIAIAEGPDAADALVRLGVATALSWPGGAQQAPKVDVSPLQGKQVILCPDDDDEGYGAMADIAFKIANLAESIRVWKTPERFKPAGKGDAKDVYAQGGTLDDFESIDVTDLERYRAPVTDADALVSADPHADAVLTELARMRARRDAQRLFEVENNPTPDLPALTRLDAFLSEPDDDAEYVIDQLVTAGANNVIAAQFKAGKSTLIGNMIRSLADGVPFLGSFHTKQVERIVLIDDELDPRTLRRWLKAQNIQHPERVELLSLRGKVSTFDIVNPVVRAEWARTIGKADVVILDCLRPILDSLGLDENKDAGKFLVPFDALKAEAGIDVGVIVHHMGHNGERSRGDSRILDWPDASWRIVRESEDPSSPRYFSAFGRDVNVAEGALLFDPDTRALTYVEGNRKQARSTAGAIGMKPTVLSFVRANPGCSGEQLLSGIGGNDKDKRGARDLLIDVGLIEARTRAGKGGGKAYFHTTPVTPAEPRLAEVLTPVTPVYRRGYGLENEITEPQPESEIF